MVTIQELKQLSELEMDIYNYIVKNKERILSMKLKDIAEEVHVSSSTLSRCIKKLGYVNFDELKAEIKLERVNQNTMSSGTIDYLIQYFKRVDREEFQKDIRKIATIVMQCYDVMFLGLGISGAYGKVGASLFNRKGKKAFVVEDFSTRIDNVYDGRTCVIVLSISGETRELNDMVLRLKQKGLTIIAITNSASSTLAKLADIVLCYYMPSVQDCYYYSSATQVPVVYILEQLSDAINEFCV